MITEIVVNQVKLRAGVGKWGGRCGGKVRGVDGGEEKVFGEGTAGEADDLKSLARARLKAVHQTFVECPGECGEPRNVDLAKLQAIGRSADLDVQGAKLEEVRGGKNAAGAGRIPRPHGDGAPVVQDPPSRECRAAFADTGPVAHFQ